ncbi:hypothetical protein MAQ5080_01457 [Marinomonas aquimarina]|uniref:Uncharacterized protein n=1 Tax=Marinomonas aquimarina TaxID=295068 RepID=A0A1A8TBT7_9GAMM|nr:NfeD family protein [Marinomonas aquimarina]SBS29639.1 hypothetical protein MAQ5080_01457 [Marinomonas aquimarina]
MEFLSSYFIEALAILGLALLAIEVLVLGMSTLVLLLTGLGLLLTALSMYLGWLPSTWQWALMATTGYTVLLGVVLWPLFKRIQTPSQHKAVQSDLIGHSFYLPMATSAKQPGSYRFSGVDWRLVSQQPIAEGTLVEVIDVQVGTLVIQAASAEDASD